MATYHLHLSKIGRSEGRSAIAAAAYRSCSKLFDPEQGKTFNFVPKRRQLVKSGIILPEQKQNQLKKSDQDLRQELWIKAHEADRRKNSVLAREITVALPKELKKDEWVTLVQSFAGLLADRYQVAVDFAIHSPKSSTNVHAHLMFTTREIDLVGQELVLGQKTRILDCKATGGQEIEKIRENWENLCNQYLLDSNLSISRKSQRQRGKTATYLSRQSYYLLQRGRTTLEAERRLNKAATATISPQEQNEIETILNSPQENSEKFDEIPIQDLEEYFYYSDAITSLLEKEEEPEPLKKNKKKNLDLDYGD